MRRSVPQGTGSGQTEGKGSRKATPAERIRGELMDAVGEASLNFSGYCRLAAQAMLQTAMEVEAAEFIGRVTYQRRGGGPVHLPQRLQASQGGHRRRPAGVVRPPDPRRRRALPDRDPGGLPAAERVARRSDPGGGTGTGFAGERVFGLAFAAEPVATRD